jgi:hypothetical protein
LEKEKFMSTRRIASNNKTAIYIILVVVVIVAFLLLGGGPWIRNVFHGGRSMGMAHLNWAQILISFGLGFLLCLVVYRRKW